MISLFYLKVREFKSTGRENIQATFNFLCRCYDLGRLVVGALHVANECIPLKQHVDRPARKHPKGEHVVEDFIDQYKERKGEPDLIIILSALWDINRWGPRFVSSEMNCV